MEASHVAIIAVCISTLSLIVMVIEKVWGGGNGLANRFHKLDRDTTIAMQAMRAELMARIDQYEDNYQVSSHAITANIHALREGLLELRAKMAEEYIPKGGLDDVRAEMRVGFAKVDEAVSRLQDMVMHFSRNEAVTRPAHR